jgi:hypothetical protein
MVHLFELMTRFLDRTLVPVPSRRPATERAAAGE